jgi:hypothetical protein
VQHRPQLGQGQPRGLLRGEGGRQQGPGFAAQQAAALGGKRGEDGGVELAQQRAQLVVRVGARPDRVLLGAGQHRDRLGQLGVGRQWSMRRHVGAQNVGQHERVTGVGLAARDRVPVPIPRHGHRVDRVDRASGGAQTGHQQAVAGLDRHRDRCVGSVPGVGQQLQQGGEPGRVVTDSPFDQQGPVLVDQRYVVMVLGPVDPAEHRHRLFLLSSSTITVQTRTWP